ncbi:helix-turn-helix domain-containing protein [Streptomyces sp. HNM0575]|uniref:MmyB family transcriptional regulator n=1 Tax=Streptomyces sp. HNM0575 TaxID=2716338 RepID=UPI00145F1FC7|nr:helix-turn-helix domain-containing protein [Streptomyces sp. HNM0575]NLU71580.1 helix-turn-helix domain-containing protein [Streptomyces sp. HNM0575]
MSTAATEPRQPRATRPAPAEGPALAGSPASPAAPAAPASPGPSAPVPAPGPASGAAPGPAAARIRRGELAAFLRSRRERVAPEQVGLPRGQRRRTPGLRREEVAQLSAVGVTWYTWLEQSRDINVSAQVLDALARALLLDPSERAHLFALADTPDPTPSSRCTYVTSSVLRMLRRLEPFPACVQNARYDILAHNRTYGRLLRDLDAVPPEDRNCMWLTFTDSEWAAGLPDREETMRLMVARFRARMAEHLTEPAWKALLTRMRRASPEFRELWERHEVAQATDPAKRFRNPVVGTMRFTYDGLWLSPSEGPRLGTYVPADAESEQRLERLYALITADG